MGEGRILEMYRERGLDTNEHRAENVDMRRSVYKLVFSSY